MALSSKVGSFNTGTGAVGTTVVVNDVGFQPKIIFFWWNGRTGTTDASGRADHKRGFGAATGASDRRYITSLSQDTPTAMLANTMQGNAACIGITTTSDTIDGLMDVQSIDSGGFTLVVDDVFTASYRIHYLALGGDDITNVETGQFTGNAGGGTGNQDVTSLSYEPNFVLIFSSGQATANNTVRGDSRITIGAATGSSNQAVWAGGSNDGASTSNTSTYCRAGEVIASMGTALSQVDDRAAFSTFLSNGFRVNWSEVSAGGGIYFFVAIKGGGIVVDNFLTQTDTVTTMVESGFGFQPTSVMIVSACKAENSSDTISDDDEWSLGAFTGTSSRVAMSIADDDNAGTAIVSTGLSHDQVYQNLNANTGAVEGEMDVQSVDSGGFTLIMDDADPSQAFVWYIAFGNNPGTQHTKDVSGGITPAGALLKATNKPLTGGITPSGANIKQTSKAFAGGITPTGSLLKQAQKLLSGAINSIVGTLTTSRGYIRAFDGSITPTGTIVKSTSKLLGGGITPSGGLLKTAQKALAGALSSIVGTLTTSRGYIRSFEGTITPTGTVSKNVSKFFSGTLTSAGNVLKQINKFLSGALTLAGTLVGELVEGGQTFFQDLSGSLTPTGQLLKSTAKSFSGSLPSAGSLTKTTVKLLAGVVTLAGTLLKLPNKSLSGTVTSSGTVNKSTTKTFSGTLSISGIIGKLVGKNLSGSIIPSGNVTSSSVFLKVLEGSIALAGSLSRSVSKNLTGNISPLGTLNKFITKTFSGVLSFAGSLTTLSGVIEVVTKVYLLGSRVMTITLEGARNRIAALRGSRKHKEEMRGSREDLN